MSHKTFYSNALTINKRNIQLITIIISLPVFLCCLDVSAISILLKNIALNLEISYKTSSLTYLIYLVNVALTFYIINIKQSHNAKNALILGTIIFCASGFLIGLTENYNTLLLLRAYQGISSAVLLFFSIKLITSIFSATEQFKAFTTFSFLVGLGVTFGSLIAGFTLTLHGWRLLFLLNLPMLILTLILMHKYLPQEKQRPSLEKSKSNHWVWILLLCLPLAFLIKKTLGSIIIFTALVLAILHIINKPKFKISQNYLYYLALGSVPYIIFYTLMYYLGINLQNSYRLTSIQSSLLYLPFTISFSLGPFIIKKILSHISTKTAEIASLLIVGLAGFSFLLALHESTTYLLAATLFMLGLSTASLNLLSIGNIFKKIPSKDIDNASSVFNFTKWAVGATSLSIYIALNSINLAYCLIFIIALITILLLIIRLASKETQ